MVGLKLVFLFLFGMQPSFAGNGSTGVGNGPIRILKTVAASNLGGKFKLSGDQVVSVRDGVPFLSVSDISPAELETLLISPQLIPAQLGDVDAFEFTPAFEGGKSLNFWIVCERDKVECKKLVPLNRRGALVEDFIGTLIRN